MSDVPVTRTIHVLLVEDDEVDAEALVRAAERHHLQINWTVVKDGVEALRTLRGINGYSPPQQPCVIMLDLNLPRMNGIEFLKELRADPQLHHHIVFVVSTSNRTEDKLAAYSCQIAGYWVKGHGNNSISNLISVLRSYGRSVEFPPV